MKLNTTLILDSNRSIAEHEDSWEEFKMNKISLKKELEKIDFITAMKLFSEGETIYIDYHWRDLDDDMIKITYENGLYLNELIDKGIDELHDFPNILEWYCEV